MTDGQDSPRPIRSRPAPGPTTRSNTAPTIPYQNFAPQFRAELFDPDHWADVFARSGAKYVALTSKHHEGFALWPSKEASATWGRPWNAVETGPKRDMLGDLTEAVRRKGLKMGFYYSLYEWYNPLWLSDKPRYIREHMFPQFKDLVTRYKPVHHLQRRRVGPALGRVAQSGTAGLAVQRISGEGGSGHQRPLGQGHAATSTAATGPPNTRPA